VAARQGRHELGFPFRASGYETTIRRPAPLLGEHTAEVLDELGLPQSEIKRLAEVGVVQLA
jgi:crotonobetainyl-CoA:carnitine CoA-transferase CaiB-like acyl-CoA transferase